MKKTKINAAVVGCGRMGASHNLEVEKYSPSFWMPQSHLAAIGLLESTSVVACCDINEDNLEKAQIRYGVEKTYTSYLDMIDSENIDLLTIATRTPHKKEIICAAIARGIKAIHVEKPLCNSLVELLEIEKQAQLNNVYITYGCIRRYMPVYMRLRDMSQLPEHGGVSEVHVEMNRSMLLWVHTHSIDLVLFYMRGIKPVKVQGWFEALEFDESDPSSVMNDPILLSATIEFENGVVGRIGQTKGHALTVSTNSGKLEILSNGKEFTQCLPSANSPYVERSKISIVDEQGVLGGTALPISLLVECLSGDVAAQKVVNESMDAMYGGQRIIYGLLNSHLESGRRVDLEHEGRIVNIRGIYNGSPA